MLINYGHIDFAYDIFNENEDLKFYSDSLMEFFKTSFRTEKRSFLQRIPRYFSSTLLRQKIENKNDETNIFGEQKFSDRV